MKILNCLSFSIMGYKNKLVKKNSVATRFFFISFVFNKLSPKIKVLSICL